MVEEAEDGPIRRPQRGYIRSVVGIDWEDSRRRGGNDDQEEEEENDWQKTLNVTCSASNTIGRQTHTDTRMFNLERVRPGDVKGTTTITYFAASPPPPWLCAERDNLTEEEFHFYFIFFFVVDGRPQVNKTMKSTTIRQVPVIVDAIRVIFAADS